MPKHKQFIIQILLLFVLLILQLVILLTLVSCDRIEKMLILGDVNQDGKVNSVDAAEILAVAARSSVGGESGLTKAQKKSADVNKDNKINALDASIILAYSAYKGVNDDDMSLEKFVNQ